MDFYVNYMDDSETLKAAEADGVWCVNEGQPMHCPPEIEKNEVGLNLFYGSLSPDWVQYDKGCSSKIVDLYECSDYTVKYTYSVKVGETLVQPEVVEIKMDTEAFKEEMLKYRIENV